MPDAQRYSRILQAAKYYGAIDNYIKYITDTTKRGSRVGSGTKRAPSQPLVIDPFGITLATGQVVPCSCAKPTWETYKATFAGRTKERASVTDENLIVPVAEFRAARVNITTGRGNGVPATSAVTGLKYLKYGGKSTSVPFGRKDNTETMNAAYEELKTAVTAKTSGAIVSLRPEVTR